LQEKLKMNIMQAINHIIRNYSAVSAKAFGAHGTPEKAKFDEDAYAFYTSRVLLDTRKSAKITQSELSQRIGADKSYISRIEKRSDGAKHGNFLQNSQCAWIFC
jgi:ribosome-binding protein aMBF1 (putative translation factor)